MKEREMGEFRESIEETFLDVDLRKLGFVGLKCESLPVLSWMWSSWHDTLYVDQTGTMPWVNGAVGETEPHLTLLYGLLRPAHKYGDLVRKLLSDLSINPLKIERLAFFNPSGSPYSCIVGILESSPELREANRRLRWLPHVDTFVEYRPHITLAYVQSQKANAWYDQLKKYAVGRYITFGDLDLGGQS